MKTELNVLPDVNGNELIIREGKASEIKEPVKISIAGDITAVANYLNLRRKESSKADNYQPVFDELSIVIVDKEKQTIQLQVAPNNAYSTTITAELKDSEEIKAFHINDNKLFERTELQKLIRFNKRFFSDAEQQQVLLEKLTKLKVDSTVNSNIGNDNRGNKNLNIDKTVNTDLPAGFFLIVPIFKNTDAVKFWVELNLDSSEGATRFWLESVELIEVKERLLNEIFAEQLKACEGLVVINK